MRENATDLIQSQLLIVGSLTGAAAHELNNIMGILSLRLEKVQADLGFSAPAGPDTPVNKDLAVIQRNLGRAVDLIAHLQSLLKAGTDDELISEPQAVREAIAASIATHLAIYERKIEVNHTLGLVNINPVSRGALDLFLASGLQRILLSVGAGSAIDVEWQANAAGAGGRLEIRGRSATAGTVGVSHGTNPVLDLVAARTEALADWLAPGGFNWTFERRDDPETTVTRREARLTFDFPG